MDFQKLNGLIPAVIQDVRTLQVLMVGFMNEEALERTRQEKVVYFYSRTKGRLWKKGESSGNVLSVVSIKEDCDQDTVLIFAEPKGPTCHTGTTSCFGEGSESPHSFLGELEKIIRERATEKNNSSYTASLLKEGIKKIAQKVGEEGVEVALGALADTDEKLTGEAADLLYHLLVLLYARGLSLKDAVAVLKERHKGKK